MMKTKVPLLRARLRDAAADAMLAAAEQVMIRKGYEQATMQDIAAAAGCAVGTLYLHFKNKQVLFRAILQKHGTTLNQRLRDAVAAANDPLANLRALVVIHIQWSLDQPGLVDLLCTTLPLRYYDFQQSLRTIIPQEHGNMQSLGVAIIRQAQAAGQIRTDFSAEVLNDLLGGMILTLLDQFAARPRAYTLEQQIDLAWGFLATGLQAAPVSSAQRRRSLSSERNGHSAGKKGHS